MKKRVFKFGEFTQMDRKFLTKDDGFLPENIIGAAFDAKNNLYLASSREIYKFSGEKMKKISSSAFKSISKIKAIDGHIFILNAEKIAEIKNDKLVPAFDGFNSKLVDITAARDGVLWAVTETALYKKAPGDAKFYEFCEAPEDVTCISALSGNTVYLGSSTIGLLALKGKRWHWAELVSAATGIVSDNVTSIAFDDFNHLWVGTDKGVCIYDGKSHWLSSKEIPCLPSGNINDMCFSADGKKYFASTECVMTLINGKLDYYSYSRWLLWPDVSSLAVADDGTIAAVTKKGISLITPRLMTLEEKAEHFDKMAEKYFVRKDGYCVSRTLFKPGDMDDGWQPSTDNDGLFTGLYCGSQCFRYGATKSETALLNARRAVKALIKLHDITGNKGFPARAIRYDDEPDFKTGVREEWHVCDDGKCEWLGETSSDEVTGHFYAFSLYYDLCAADDEKPEIVRVVKDMMDHIISNNFHLVDIDGLPTTWANWEPSLINYDDKWFYERGTNSLEILSFLKTTHHITGDEKYNEVFERLINDYHYAMNAMHYKAEDAHLAHIDDQLTMNCIVPLMRYLDNPAQKAIIAIGLRHHWDYEKTERNPLFNIVFSALTGEKQGLETAAISLSEIPLDITNWPLYNSHRADLVWDTEQEALGILPQLKEALPYSARIIMHNDTNQFVCDCGCEDLFEVEVKRSNRIFALPSAKDANAMRVPTPSVYLQPYWMARYYGLIED